MKQELGKGQSSHLQVQVYNRDNETGIVDVLKVFHGTKGSTTRSLSNQSNKKSRSLRVSLSLFSNFVITKEAMIKDSARHTRALRTGNIRQSIKVN